MKQRAVPTSKCIYGQIIFDKVAKNTQWRKIVPTVNGTGKTGYSHVKE